MASSNPQQRRTPMPRVHPLVRRRSFAEVACGYTRAQAMHEAQRCRVCADATCVHDCPLGVDIRSVIELLAAGNVESAFDVLTASNPLPGICSRVCPQDDYCERRCGAAAGREPVGVARLERFAADWAAARHLEPRGSAVPTSDHAVAVVGAGPAGLLAAADLARQGHRVTVFEAHDEPGGTLTYDVPEFRLPKAVVQREIAQLRHIGVDIRMGHVIGRTFTIDELFTELEYDAVFLASGAQPSPLPELPGIDLNGVYEAQEYLAASRIATVPDIPASTPGRLGLQVVVVGGGDLALDAARTALRLGARHVSLVYDRMLEDMTARREDIDYAIEEGVQALFLATPRMLVGDSSGHVKTMQLQELRIEGADAQGRRATLPIDDARLTLDADVVIFAETPGTSADLEAAPWGSLRADPETGATQRKGLFAGGHLVTGAATITSAMAAGRRAARAIHRYLETPLPDGC